MGAEVAMVVFLLDRGPEARSGVLTGPRRSAVASGTLGALNVLNVPDATST